MNCEYVKSKISDLLDESTSRAEQDLLMQHIATCPTCSKEFEATQKVVAALTPVSEIQATSNLKSIVMNTLENSINSKSSDKGKKINLPVNRWVKIAGIAALLIIAFGIIILFKPQVLNTQATAAQTLLNKSFDALSDAKTMIMHFNVRTVPGDNFDLIQINGEFIENTVWKNFDETGKWKIQKPGISVLMDGKHQYKYMEKSGEGFVSDKNSNMIDWMKIFLDPKQILQNEEAFALENKAEYKINNLPNETILTVKAKAMGDMRNTYMLNKSIPESNNRRVYHFHKLSNRLKAVEIYIQEKGKEIEVLKVNAIDYDIVIPESVFVINLPSGVKWLDNEDIMPDIKAGSYKNCDEAAKAFFEALSDENWATVFMICPYIEKSTKLEEFKTFYGGLKILTIGKSFKSGLYGGYFVPYEIRLKSGETLSHKLALRNDNKNKVWLVDGGF